MVVEFKTPAFLSQRKQTINWQPLNREEKLVLTKIFPGASSFLKLQSNQIFPFGFFRFCNFDNSEKFAKIIPSSFSTRHEEGNKIMLWLWGKGIEIYPAENSASPTSLPNCRVIVYPYFDGRYATPSSSDMENLGVALANLHNYLKVYPNVSEVKLAANVFKRELWNVYEEIKYRYNHSWPIPSEIKNIILRFAEEFSKPILDNDAQIIHGDLNYGNVLFDKKSNKPIFIDFEDAAHSYGSPLLDLAFVLERFCVEQDFNNCVVLGKKLVSKYYGVSKLNFGNGNELVRCLKQLKIEAMLVLCNHSIKNNVPVHAKEWKKFSRQFVEAGKNIEIFKRIVDV